MLAHAFVEGLARWNVNSPKGMIGTPVWPFHAQTLSRQAMSSSSALERLVSALQPTSLEWVTAY